MTNILVLGGRHWAVEDCLKIRKADNTFWFLIIVARSSHVGFAPELGVLASFTRLGVTAWGWRDLRMKEQFQLTLDSQESCDDAHENTNDDTSEKDKNKASENTVKFTAGGSPRGGRCVLKLRDWLWRNF